MLAKKLSRIINSFVHKAKCTAIFIIVHLHEVIYIFFNIAATNAFHFIVLFLFYNYTSYSNKNVEMFECYLSFHIKYSLDTFACLLL